MLLKRFYKFGVAISLIALPFMTLAANELKGTGAIFTRILAIVESTLVPLAYILAIAAFLFGIAKYIWSVGAGGKEEGKQIMVWGVIALTVMSAVWGIVRFIRTDLGIDQVDSVKIPTIVR